MSTTTKAPGFLALPPVTEAVQASYADDLTTRGYVSNLSRLWAHAPDLRAGLISASNAAATAAGLSMRDRSVVVTAVAVTLGDRYCALVWGDLLTETAGDDVARHVFRGEHDRLPDRDRILAGWARRVTADPNATVAEDVAQLRRLGMADGQILALTVFAAVRRAFASVNDALGLPPDEALVAGVRPMVRELVGRGRRTGLGC